MSYQVVWLDDAFADLWNVWQTSTKSERPSVIQAAKEFDVLAEHNPRHIGESRMSPQRIVFHGPLIITFEVNEREKQVIVQGVRHIQTSKP